MSKPRLGSGRIPFQLGISADPIVEATYQGDAYSYDGTGPVGSITGGTVQPGPNQDSPTGSITGGTVIDSEYIYD